MQIFQVAEEIRKYITASPIKIDIPDFYAERALAFARKASCVKTGERNHLNDNINENGRILVGKLGEIALEILLGREIVDWNVGHSSEFNKPDLFVSGIPVGIKSVLEKHLCPLVSREDPEISEIITVVHERPRLKQCGTTQIIDGWNYSVSICGVALPHVLKHCRSDAFVKNKNKSNGPLSRKTAFWGFRYLKIFKNEEELGRCLINNNNHTIKNKEKSMGKLNDTVSSLPGDGGERDYAKEVKIVSGTSNVLRFIDGQDSFVRYNISWIPSDDDDVIRPYIIENEFEGISILGRMLGDKNNYFRGGYLESKKGQFGKVNTHQQKDPELFKVMTEYWNPAYQGTGSCRPKEEFIFNVIHRNAEVINNQQVNWCSTEKHTKIIRMGQKALKALKGVIDNDGDASEYDINYTKQGSGTDTLPTMQKAGVNVTSAVPGPLSEEERNYERYDLKEIVKLTSAYYCLKHIPNKIKRMDAVMGTNFFAEFEKQAKIEQELWEKNKNANTNAAGPVQSNAAGPTVTTPPQTNEANPENPFSDENIPFDQGSVNPRVSLTTSSISCPKCGEKVPEGTMKCPKCQEQLLMQCDVCHNFIPATTTTCICGAEYK